MDVHGLLKMRTRGDRGASRYGEGVNEQGVAASIRDRSVFDRLDSVANCPAKFLGCSRVDLVKYTRCRLVCF